MQDSLEKLLGERPPVTGCSRTDAGVHAEEFCCHFDCSEQFPETAFLKGLDSLLPDDISVKNCRTVENGFHARYSAKGKTYKYYILNSSVSDPFMARYSWKIERRLDESAMDTFCGTLVGRHDFFAFSSSGRTVEDTVRTVTECRAERRGNLVTLTVTADGFLYNMVRIIVGTAVGVSDGRIGADAAGKIFASKDRSLAGVTAPPQGLFLKKVIY